MFGNGHAYDEAWSSPLVAGSISSARVLSPAATSALPCSPPPLARLPAAECGGFYLIWEGTGIGWVGRWRCPLRIAGTCLPTWLLPSGDHITGLASRPRDWCVGYRAQHSGRERHDCRHRYKPPLPLAVHAPFGSCHTCQHPKEQEFDSRYAQAKPYGRPRRSCPFERTLYDCTRHDEEHPKQQEVERVDIQFARQKRVEQKRTRPRDQCCAGREEEPTDPPCRECAGNGLVRNVLLGNRWMVAHGGFSPKARPR
jgi:hypothetical protein